MKENFDELLADHGADDGLLRRKTERRRLTNLIVLVR